MNLMIVAMNLNPQLGGAEASLLALIEHLSIKEHKITIVGGETDIAHRPYLSESVDYLPYSIKTKNRPSLLGFRGTFRLLRRINSIKKFHAYARHIEEKIKPDLVISQKPPFPYTSTHTPCINFVRDLEFITYFGGSKILFDFPRYLVQRYWGRKILNSLKMSNIVISNSQHTQSILNNYSITSTVIFPFIKPRDNIKNIYSHIPGYILLLSANLSIHKGIKIVLQLARKMTNRRFIVTGEDVHGIAPKFPTNIKWIPWINDPAELLKYAAMLIVPSQWPETFGRVVIEAQRIGIPVLASDIGGLPETVGNGGILINPHDSVDKWRDAIELLYENDYMYRLLKERAKKNSGRYSLEELNKRFDEILMAYDRRESF